MNITHEVALHLGVLSERIDRNNTGWTKEINLVSWNGNDPKLDIREWNHDKSRMSKGLTLTFDEAETLCKILNEYLGERGQ